MSAQPDVRALAGLAGEVPFGFDEFERRRAQVRHRTRAAGWSATAAIGVLAIVPVVAVVTQPAPAARVIAAPASELVPVAEVFRQPPALVDMGRFVVTSELEDHIAMLDAGISAARLSPVSGEEIRRMEAAREQISDSLRSVNYAHALLEL
jgi:hypothetical protein